MAVMDSNITAQQAREDRAIYRALRLLEGRMRAPGAQLNDTRAVQAYLVLHLAEKEREIFTALWLDIQHRVIAADDMFAGTLTQTSVYPREVIKRALQHNAAAVIFAHNHPSGVAEPSQSDQLLTSALKQALAMVEVRVLDHFIVAGDGVLSFAACGLLGLGEVRGDERRRKKRTRKTAKAETATATA